MKLRKFLVALFLRLATICHNGHVTVAMILGIEFISHFLGFIHQRPHSQMLPQKVRTHSREDEAESLQCLCRLDSVERVEALLIRDSMLATICHNGHVIVTMILGIGFISHFLSLIHQRSHSQMLPQKVRTHSREDEAELLLSVD